MKLLELFEGAAKKKTLYLSRKLTNGEDLIAWAKEQGFETCLPADKFHVTIAYSKKEISWDHFTDSFDQYQNEAQEDDDRKMEVFGNAVVLRFESKELHDRWKEFIDDFGASYDFDDYKPHVTITYEGVPEGMDIKDVKPYDGILKFGPEIYKEVTKDWAGGVKEKKLTESFHDDTAERARKLITDIEGYGRHNGVRVHMKFPAFIAPELEITDFYADTPGQGAGTRVMEYICQRADEEDFNVYAKPEQPRNVEFYGRFGFEKSPRHFGMLVRYSEPEMDDDERADIEAMKRGGLDESFNLADVEFDDLYQTFKTSYEAETGSSWSEGKLYSRARNWTFYGDPSGFVAVRRQNSGMKKLVAAAGDPRGVLKGLSELAAEGGPIWGAVSKPLLSAAKKRGLIAPHELPGGPLMIKALISAIPPSVFGDVTPRVAPDGGLMMDYDDVGTQTKYLVGNKEYFKEAAKLPALLALKVPGVNTFLKLLGVSKV